MSYGATGLELTERLTFPLFFLAKLLLSLWLTLKDMFVGTVLVDILH